MSAPESGARLVVMAGTVDQLEEIEAASSTADRAAVTAGVSITELTSLDDLAAAAKLYDTVWSSDDGSAMPLGLLRALSFSNNYVAGAFSDGELLGAVTGFLGGGESTRHLHSHILGVLPSSRSRNVGYALKLHQRAWALNLGLASVSWTFDPLVAKNAYFNLTKLGAEAGAYLTNFYGEMNDAQNVGEESDRLVVNWGLDSGKAVAAASGELDEPDIDELRRSGASVVLDADSGGHPVIAKPRNFTLLLRVPSDIVGIRLEDPKLGRDWRIALRETLGALLAPQQDSRSFKIKAASKTGWYVVTTAT